MRLPRIAVLGAGHVGPVIARIAIAAGYPVTIASSAEPERIELIAQVLAPGAEPKWAADAIRVGIEGQLSDSVEVAAYYLVSELVTNTAKHAQASSVEVSVTGADGVLHIVVRDDGVGGADPARGSGLAGLRDRIEALGGSMSVRSPRGGGTAVEAALPLDDDPHAAHHLRPSAVVRSGFGEQMT
jgi:signal transduction histidine kinase